MALADFIPTIWSARFTSRLYPNWVYANLCNRNYEGEIAERGNKVTIPTAETNITVGDYEIGSDIAAAQQTDGGTQELIVDQQKYFHFIVEDITRVQSAPNVLDENMDIAARRIAGTVDGFLKGVFEGAFDASRAINSATAADATGETILASFIAMRRLMTENHIPLMMRWAVIHPRILEKIENHFITQGGAAAGVFAPATADSVVRGGFSGNLLGFDLYVTTEVPLSGAGAAQKYRCACGQGMLGVTFAEQITEIEAYRPERRFGDAIKGLYVYGAKAVEPKYVFYNEFDNPAAG